MAKKQVKAQPKKQESASANPKRLYLIIATLVAIALGAYYIIGVGKTKSGPNLKGGTTEEKTLTAKNPKLQLLSPSETGISFENEILEDEQHNVIRNINFYNGGGVTVADINNDQLPDIYFVCTNGKNRLYLNQGNFKFKDITDQAGVGSEKGFDTAVNAADVNADGFLDLIVCRAGPEENEDRVLKVFINNQNLTFTEKANELGLSDKSPCTGVNFFDMDNDGDLDCYLLNYPTDLGAANSVLAKTAADGKTLYADLSPRKPHDSDRLFRNDNGRFTDVSKQAGIANFGFGLSVGVTDINGDGWQDIFVGNDFIQPDNFFINNQHGVFVDRNSSFFRHGSMSTMGSALADFDNDARVDLFAVDMWPRNNYRQKSLKTANTLSRYLTLIKYGYFEPVARNVLQRNNGNGTFSDIACAAGIFNTDWSWSCLLADFDNDGYKDIHIANGYRKEVTNRDYQEFILPEVDKKRAKSKKKDYEDLMDYLGQMPAHKIRNLVFQNKGNWQFEDKSGDWMTMPASWSCGSAWADFDADGDLDLVVNNLEQPAFVYKNLSREQNSGNYLQAKLQGAPLNPFAVGASMLIEYQGQKQYQELHPNHGIFSSVEHLFHFGLGQTTQLDRLTVRWPDGKLQTLTNVPANQRLVLNYNNASGYIASLTPPNAEGQTLFSDKTASSGVTFRHKENAFNDFESWLLNIWTISDLGPLTAQGDINGDGLDDFYIGNGPNAPAGVYLQTGNGSFKAMSTAVFEADNQFEDHGGLFFDADGDKDLDLFVLSGGAEASASTLWQSRLYLNDGKGNFSKSSGGALPEIKDVCLRAGAFDYDGDGDQDLFLGGRLVPKNWPLSPRSLVLQNNGGKFTDVTAQVAGDFERCGMVTDLQWHDLDGDQKPELVVTGEWMPVSVFKLANNRLQNATSQFGLEKTNGMWNRLAVADLDKDGDLDLVTGNFGLNLRFMASNEAPLRCFAKDFDNNGTLDPVVALQEEGKIYPLVQKDVLVKQIPSLKKRFLYSEDYAKATVSDIWSQKDLDAATNLVCYELQSCWWENQGGKFIKHVLPFQAQVSVVQGIAIDDFNQDGHADILLCGNKYGFEVETNRVDAGNGALFLGGGNKEFTWMDNIFTGFWAVREARDLAVLKSAGGKKTYVVANNNSPLQIFTK
ncbi:MAG: VCBS repeat-containing protein [Saprospiraceae bacterium]|nr:VCBS repeat-containing protein [Saprospiraceae bacterium]